MHEARLNIGADQHTEPNQIDAELVGNRRQERNDEECDFKEIEEEGDHEDEGVDEDQEADLSTWERCQQILDPNFSAYALEHKAEGPRPDQNIDHHRGDGAPCSSPLTLE